VRPDGNPPEQDDEPRPRPAWLRWTMIVGGVVLLLCCIGCGIELVRLLGWLSSTHAS
jgi:hypothetical protein